MARSISFGPVQVTCIRGTQTHYIVNNLIDGGLKITATDRFNNTRYATISDSHACEPIRFMLDLLEKYEGTDVGRINLEHYLDLAFAFYAD